MFFVCAQFVKIQTKRWSTALPYHGWIFERVFCEGFDLKPKILDNYRKILEKQIKSRVWNAASPNSNRTETQAIVCVDVQYGRVARHFGCDRPDGVRMRGGERARQQLPPRLHHCQHSRARRINTLERFAFAQSLEWFRVSRSFWKSLNSYPKGVYSSYPSDKTPLQPTT